MPSSLLIRTKKNERKSEQQVEHGSYEHIKLSRRNIKYHIWCTLYGSKRGILLYIYVCVCVYI